MADDERGSAFAGLGRRGLVGKMHEQLDELLAARDQMEQLLRVFVEIGAKLGDLDATLHRVIAAAMELTAAPYGALRKWRICTLKISVISDCTRGGCSFAACS